MSKRDDDNFTKTRTTENTARRRGETISATYSRTEGRSVNQSQINGVQGHVPNDQRSSHRGGGDEPSQSGSPNPGKILEAVKLIEEKHLSYVRAHQEQLVTSLNESKESENDFKEAIQELEAKIHQLISDKGIEESK